jgi:biopolymer transport protein ExbD
LLPQSNNQTSAKAITSVSITKDFKYYVEMTAVPFENLERQLQGKLMNSDDPTMSLHVDQSVPVGEMVKVMNIASRNKYKVILATSPERTR